MSGDSVDGAECKMPKADELRGFVSQRLAAASREILAAVERLVAGYEAEASGFRQEIERQRKHLETLQRPQFASTEPGTKCSWIQSHDEEEEEEEELPVCVENLEDLSQTSTRVQFEKRKPGRPRISSRNVDLKVCFLEDSNAQRLSKNVYKKSPVLKVTCPRDLREAGFLCLLRRTFPQLAGDDRQFDILTSSKTRRLQCLRLKTVTPKEIQNQISCTGAEESTLFIRLKAQKTDESDEVEGPPLQTLNIRTKSRLSTLTCADIRPHTSLAQKIDSSRAVIQSCSSTSPPPLMETDEADDEDAGSKSTVELHASVEEGERQQVHESQSKTIKLKSRQYFVKDTKIETENSNELFFSCKVCGELHKLEGTFVQHAWSHVNDFQGACGVCGSLFQSVEALKDHLQSRHRTEDCPKCGESFLNALSLNEHVAAHSGEKPYECQVCKSTFALKSSLEIHQNLHEESRTHECETCHRVFELKEQLDAHLRTHAAKRPHVCGVCGKSLSDYRSLSRHKFTHTGERPHSCQICGRRFKLIGALRQHEKTHVDRERSYLCDVCCKMFLTSKQLQIHMRTHTNEKPYHCSQCGKGFTTRGPLTVHMRVHTGETPYRCPDCGCSFKRKSNLDDHRTVHSGVKAFICSICGKACARRTHLTVHMRTHNGERPYQCSVCSKAFTQSHCLKTHMRSHQEVEAPL
ncbi:zinc finger protein 436-like isoform X2 [Betta splendens]|uniref:Zinc finger protein 436-like isoform X2 n=1 Tax=Betta splendens TaxID=158456 RepID=A0A9W2XEA9_BETSP|nr:zinc finger protein 436-like isoform X2 [Betta splendens]